MEAAATNVTSTRRVPCLSRRQPALRRL